MRARARQLVSIGALAAALHGARSAHATDCSGVQAPCINDDTLWPHAGPARFVGVGSAETVAPGQLGFGLVAAYLKRPIVLSTSIGGGDVIDNYAVDDQVNATFLWAYGVSDRLQLDFAVPLTVGQGGTGLQPISGGAGLKDTAVRDLRFGLAYAIVPHPRSAPPSSLGVVARMETSAPTGDRDQFAGERSAVFVPSVAADWRLGRLFAGAELGARLRPTTEFLGARVGTQAVAALGAGFDLLPRELLAAILEARALPTFTEQHDVRLDQATGVLVSAPNGKSMTPAEWQLSARTAPLRGGDLAIQLGGGGGIPLGGDAALTTPKWRFTLSVRWAPLGRAPSPAPSSAPATTTAAAAPIDLHLAGANDACTDEPDLVDGFFDTDGCPDEDQDKDGIDDRLDKCPLVAEDFAGLTDGCPEKK